MKSKKHIGWAVLTIAVFSMVPLVLDSETSYLVYFLFMAFTYLALAQSWNLVAGYTGQISLGLHAFFGFGAYVVAIGWVQKLFGYFDPLGIFLSGLIPAILAAAVGIPLLSKLRGDYFALGTLGLGEILRLIFVQGGTLTGGSAGLMLPSSAYASMVPYYFAALSLAVLATALTYFLIRSPVGWALIAIRDDETAAAANGVPVLSYKVLAFALGAFIAGLCGSLQGYYLFHIHPQNFYGLNWTLYPILMCVLGGSGTIVGPVIGAVFLTAVFEMAKVWLPEIHPIFSGALIIATIMFLPNGVVRLRWFQGRFSRKVAHLSGVGGE
ncbi:MAG: branched-chain amino acid ABC transporter permease [Deltaproteobacteria bacterium]|nr:branched-chain amino acid ABC transporter permease [Deltaproteobacteria bacterium]